MPTAKLQDPMSPPVLFVPGLGGSGPEHWQTRWRREVPNGALVNQANWDAPDLDTWLAALQTAVASAPGAILIGHSLGSILIAHLATRDMGVRVGGALLVAPADIEVDGAIGRQLASFAPIPMAPLPFPAIVLASADDPFTTLKRSRAFARAWGAVSVSVGALGHINTASGIGAWSEGRCWLDTLVRLAGPAEILDSDRPATSGRSGAAAH
jgi:uncharacterized protein